MKNITEIVWIILIIGMSFTFYRFGVDSTKEKQPEIKPCECVTYSQYAL